MNLATSKWQSDLNDVVSQIGGVAFKFLLARDFANSLQTANQAIALRPEQIWLYADRAHALMFLGRIKEARALYLKYRGEQKVSSDGKSWVAVILDDFAQLRKAGLTNPLMDEIEKLFSSSG